jgi:ubiquinone biosynthesis monooxygenase Coq7
MPPSLCLRALRPAAATTRLVVAYAPVHRSSPPRPQRLFSTSTPPDSPQQQQSQQPFDASPSSSSSSSPDDIPPRRRNTKPLTPEQLDFLHSAIRVNQAGELAATLIYKAQAPILTRSDPSLRPLMKHMYAQEAGHLAYFNDLIARHRVRPTALSPLWTVMSSGLGWATAMLGREAAMACTEAVETEIGDHYNGQLRTLLDMMARWRDEGYDVDAEIEDLARDIRRIRDEELEHLDHAVEHDARKADPHWLLTGVIRAGCRGAIWASERI